MAKFPFYSIDFSPGKQEESSRNKTGNVGEQASNVSIGKMGVNMLCVWAHRAVESFFRRWVLGWACHESRRESSSYQVPEDDSGRSRLMWLRSIRGLTQSSSSTCEPSCFHPTCEGEKRVRERDGNMFYVRASFLHMLIYVSRSCFCDWSDAGARAYRTFYLQSARFRGRRSGLIGNELSSYLVWLMSESFLQWPRKVIGKFPTATPTPAIFIIVETLSLIKLSSGKQQQKNSTRRRAKGKSHIA